MKNRKTDFPFFLHHPNSIYFDSGATSLKPLKVIEAEGRYLEMIGANPHATDYEFAIQANEVLDQTRMKVQKFIHAKSKDEIIFTSGATFSLNLVVNGLKKQLTKDDEVFLTSLEHSSNLLPWIVASQEVGFKIKQIPLTTDFAIDGEQLDNLISSKTKVISFASVTNTVGIFNDAGQIAKLVKAKNPEVIVVVDATQEVGHRPINVEQSDVDFLAFSAHKMYGPFGVGVLYGKAKHLATLAPLTYGGGNNEAIDWSTFDYQLAPIPARFEAGTPNIAGIYALSSAIDYLNQLGMDQIHQYEVELKTYLVKKFNELKLDQKVVGYNLNNDGPLFGFNVEGMNPQDVAAFLANDYQIATRSGAQCARTTLAELGFKTSVRVSLAIYNSTEDIDKLLEAFMHLDQVYDHIL